jgi:hypothetical protein
MQLVPAAVLVLAQSVAAAVYVLVPAHWHSCVCVSEGCSSMCEHALSISRHAVPRLRVHCALAIHCALCGHILKGVVMLFKRRDSPRCSSNTCASNGSGAAALPLQLVVLINSGSSDISSSISIRCQSRSCYDSSF